MGDSYLQVKDFLHQYKVQIFNSNYPLYGDMSRRVIRHLAQ